MLSTIDMRAIWQGLDRIWDFKLWTVRTDPITAGKVITAFIILIVGFIIASIVRRVIKRQLASSQRINPQGIGVIARIVSLFIVITAFFLAMRTIELPLTTFAFLGGGLAVGLGFGCKNLISNIIGGFILMAERPIRVNDVIEVKGSTGIVEDIGIRSTRLMTANNMHVLFPNSELLENKITNWTLNDDVILTKIDVGITYASDIEKASTLMVHAAMACEDTLEKPTPFTLFWKYGESKLEFQLYFAHQAKTRVQRWKHESEVRCRVNEALRQAGVVIAFPQMDVHLDPQATQTLPT